jgi:hypothetical protein
MLAAQAEQADGQAAQRGHHTGRVPVLTSDQQDFIRKPMFEQRRYQRGATREGKVRAVLRFDAANALDDVLSKALERTPFKTFRTVR